MTSWQWETGPPLEASVAGTSGEEHHQGGGRRILSGLSHLTRHTRLHAPTMSFRERIPRLLSNRLCDHTFRLSGSRRPRWTAAPHGATRINPQGRHGASAGMTSRTRGSSCQSRAITRTAASSFSPTSSTSSTGDPPLPVPPVNPEPARSGTRLSLKCSQCLFAWRGGRGSRAAGCGMVPPATRGVPFPWVAIAQHLRRSAF